MRGKGCNRAARLSQPSPPATPSAMPGPDNYTAVTGPQLAKCHTVADNARVIDSIESQIASLSVMMKTISQNFKPVTTPMRSANNTQYSHQNFTVDANREGTGSLVATRRAAAQGCVSRLCRATGLASHALPYRPPARQHVDPLSSNTAAAYLPASLHEVDDIIIHL